MFDREGSERPSSVRGDFGCTEVGFLNFGTASPREVPRLYGFNTSAKIPLPQPHTRVAFGTVRNASICYAVATLADFTQNDVETISYIFENSSILIS